MRAIVIDPGKAPEIRQVPNTEDGLAQLLGGAVHLRPFGQLFAALLYTAQDGPVLQPCRKYLEKWYYGRLMIIGWRNSAPCELSAELARQLAERWESEEVQK